MNSDIPNDDLSFLSAQQSDQSAAGSSHSSNDNHPGTGSEGPRPSLQ